MRNAVANLAKRLCTEFVDPDSLRGFLSARLVPLAKGTEDVRPIGIGETLRRLTGKAVMVCLKDKISEACGGLQVCAGLEGGCEAAIHAMRGIFEDDETEAVLLVDATNAFNAGNRSVGLQNVAVLCPAFYTYLVNTYRSPARLFVPSWQRELLSEEGTTQGDPCAMGMYALMMVPLIERLRSSFPAVSQVWFADDGTGAGELQALRKWWELLTVSGPKYGYHAHPGKSLLVVKPEHVQKAREIFRDSGITIDTHTAQEPIAGARHLGAALGTKAFVEAYATAKIKRWEDELEVLSQIATHEPHAAYAAYTHGFASKWTFLQRALPGIGHLFQPLEEKIRTLLLPSLTGRPIKYLSFP